MNEVLDVLKRWKLDLSAVRQRMYRAPTSRERERWHAVWLLAKGWSAAQVADALERDPHTIGEWLSIFRQVGPAGLDFEHTGGSPQPQQPTASRIESRRPGAAICRRDRAGGLELEGGAGVRPASVWEHTQSEQLPGLPPPLGLRAQAPKKRLVKANAERRAAFVREYALLRAAAQAIGAKLFFVD